MLEEGRLRCDLDESAEVHHRHAMAHVAHDRQVVRDEQEREPELTLEIGEEVQDLGLDRDVERGDGLVAHQEARAEGQRPCDPDPLPLAAAERMRVARHVIAGQAHRVEQLAHPRGGRAARGTEVAKRLADDVADREARIQRRVPVLEHHLHRPPEGAEPPLGDGGDVLALEHDAPPRHRKEAQDQPPHRRLAAAALADEAERLPLVDVERDVVHGTQRTAARRPGSRHHALDRQERGNSGSGSGCSRRAT